MSLITKNQINMLTKTMKKLLSLKADKTELATKIDRSEIEEEDAINLLIKMNVVTPMIMSDNKIVTDSSGENIYIL